MRMRVPLWIVVGFSTGVLLSIAVFVLVTGHRSFEAHPNMETVSAPPDDANVDKDVPERPPITVDEALAQLKSANVAFNTPEMARVGKQVIVEAKLSSKLTPNEVKVLIEEPGKVEVGTLKVSDRMFATLSGGSAFDVSPSGPQAQWISDKVPTGWTWQVTPKNVGEQLLILSFDAVISINGKEDKRTINTFKRRINVEVGWPETFGEWLEWIKKTGEGVSYLWGLVVLTVGGGAWAAIKRYWPRAKEKIEDNTW